MKRLRLIRYPLFFCWIVSTVPSATAQQPPDNTVLSRLYFPFDFGYLRPGGDGVRPGGLVRTGIEYRFSKSAGLFIRANLDNRNSPYTISSNQTTNVVSGKLAFADYVAGAGYRVNTRRASAFGLVQAGLSRFDYPVVTGVANALGVTGENRQVVALKAGVGIEYTIAPTAALTLEAGYTMLPQSSVFWGGHFRAFSISVGLTTTLF